MLSLLVRCAPLVTTLALQRPAGDGRPWHGTNEHSQSQEGGGGHEHGHGQPKSVHEQGQGQPKSVHEQGQGQPKSVHEQGHGHNHTGHNQTQSGQEHGHGQAHGENGQGDDEKHNATHGGHEDGHNQKHNATDHGHKHISVWANKEPISVWVNGHARSGTSTVLSMISAAAWKNPLEGQGEVFSLFEPCQSSDKYEGKLRHERCEVILGHLASCKFTGIKNLVGWSNEHSVKPGVKDNVQFDPDVATKSCERASIRALKTINVKLNKKAINQVRREAPNLKVIEVTRDPRAVYASDKREFFNNKKSIQQLHKVCDYIHDNQVESSTMLRLRFEDLVTDPEKTMRRVYETIGIPFEQRHTHWINENFNAKNCVGEHQKTANYKDCHTTSWKQVFSWRESLGQDEQDWFHKHSSCVQVAKAFNYTLY